MKANRQMGTTRKGAVALLHWARRSSVVAAAAVLGLVATTAFAWTFRDQFARIDQNIQLADDLPDLFAVSNDALLPQGDFDPDVWEREWLEWARENGIPVDPDDPAYRKMYPVEEHVQMVDGGDGGKGETGHGFDLGVPSIDEMQELYAKGSISKEDLLYYCSFQGISPSVFEVDQGDGHLTYETHMDIAPCGDPNCVHPVCQEAQYLHSYPPPIDEVRRMYEDGQLTLSYVMDYCEQVGVSSAEVIGVCMFMPGCPLGSTCDGELHIPHWSNPDDEVDQTDQDPAKTDDARQVEDVCRMSYEEWLLNPVLSDLYGDYVTIAYHEQEEREKVWEEHQRLAQEVENLYAEQMRDDPPGCESETVCLQCGYGTLSHQTHCPAYNGPVGTPDEREAYLAHQREREEQ